MSLTNKQNQEDFLNHLANRLGRNRNSDVKSPKWDNYPWDHLYNDFDQEQFIQQFIENLEAISGIVKRVSSAQVTNEIDSIINKFDAKRVLLWDDPRLEEYAIENVLKDKVEYKVWNVKEGKDKLTEYAEKSNIGITFADLGLSETGSIVLFNEGGKGRSVSLLPEVHIAILPSKQIVPRLTQALKTIKQSLDTKGYLPSLINFISGPSRTSDIEMVLTTGVHGPKELYVIIVD